MRRLIITTAVLSAFLLAGVASASAETCTGCSPWWHLSSSSRPTYLQPTIVKGSSSPDHDGEIVVTAANIGDADADPEVEPITLTDKLPKGLKAVAIEGYVNEAVTLQYEYPLECSLESLSCTFTGENSDGAISVPPYGGLQMRIAVVLRPGAKSGEVNEAAVVGGGAPSDAVKQSLTVSANPPPFGVNTYEIRPENAGGSVDTQAGSHPFQLTATLGLNETYEEAFYTIFDKTLPFPEPVALTKDLHFKVPAGLIGNPAPFAQCKLADFLEEPGPNNVGLCPKQSVVGVARVVVTLPGVGGGDAIPFVQPLFTIEPAFGEPARFGFIVHGVPVLLDTSVRTGGDYGVTVSVNNISQIAGFISSEVTFWGVPGDPRHNLARGENCLLGAAEVADGDSVNDVSPCAPLGEATPPPLLALPTSCTGPLQTTMEADSWKEPQAVQSLANTEAMSALDGCNRLPFEPSIKVTPDGQAGSTPTGLNVNVHVDQESVLNGTSLAESDVRTIAVALPEGVAINPAGGDGLEACSSDPNDQPQTPGNLIGFKGFAEAPTEPGVSNLAFTPTVPGSTAALAAGETAPLEPGIDFCANASKIGEVTIHTPLLPNPVKGFVYLAAQEANPFGSLVAMYIVAEDPVSGTIVKLSGKVVLCKDAGEVIAGMTCQGLGQIISTFENNPQLPFEDAELHFFGGERAPLASPTRCGAYTTQASFAPWSGSEAVGASSTFDITSGPATTAHPGGTPCPGPLLPFNPTSTGGATNVNAGAFSPLTTTFSTESGEQNLQAVEAKLPPGLSGLLSSVELCREPQASLGTCGANSQIGETTVSVGFGGDPFTVKGGRVYITGPYNGTSECNTPGSNGCAPFGLSVVNPAKAGPFDLANTKNNHPECDCVLVRAKIEINPETAALTVTSDPPGSPDAIPTSIEGIPLEIQHVNITTTRSAFQFNPTNCNKMQVEATLHSAEGGVDTIRIPFQVTNCAALKFEPKFSVSTSGNTSRANGASLSVNVAYPKVPQGTDADIAKVKVELPKALPSRLTTLQKACTQTQFKADPAGCPPASVIGTAVVHTQLLPVPLTGPAYFVSNGHEAFPNLIMVLQGYGITIDLVGDTFISKSGITSSTFKTVPDQPFESFALSLQNGPHSALAANGDLCKKKLTMPTEFVAQNGAVIRQNTRIDVVGCPKAHKAKKKAKHHRKGRGAKKK